MGVTKVGQKWLAEHHGKHVKGGKELVKRAECYREQKQIPIVTGCNILEVIHDL